MRSKLLPVADLNAILLSIFLVLSLGASRGLLNSHTELPEERKEVVLSEKRSVKQGAETISSNSRVVLFWSEGYFRYGANNQTTKFSQRVREAEIKEEDSLRKPHCFLLFQTPDQNNAMCRALLRPPSLREPAYIFAGGRCLKLDEDPLGAELSKLLADNQIIFGDQESIQLPEPGYKQKATEGTSIYSNDFMMVKNRSIHVVKKSLESDVAIFGAMCQTNAGFYRTERQQMAAQCNGRPPTDQFALSYDGSFLGRIAIGVADSLLPRLEERENELELNLSIRSSRDEPRDISLRMIGDGDEKPDLLVFSGQESCQEYAKGNVEPFYLQLFGVRVTDTDVKYYGVKPVK